MNSKHLTSDVSKLRRMFKESLDEFLYVEAKMIYDNVNERTLCGRLAIYLEGRKRAFGYDDYFADVEYNRQWNGEIKIVNTRDIVDGRPVETTVKVNCDLLLHSRGEREVDNLIAIEMKKSKGREEAKHEDRLRLMALTRHPDDKIIQMYSNDGRTMPEAVCGYQLGFFVILSPNRRTYRLEEYQLGRRVDPASTGRF